jgi:hypothetical protein
MHQQPPQTPRCRSASWAKSGQAASSRGLTLKRATLITPDHDDAGHRNAAARRGSPRWVAVGQDGPMGVLRFTTQLQPRGPAAAVVLDDAQVEAVGQGPKRFPVVATINGYTWRTSVARMKGEFLVGLSREVRQGAGVEAGDEVEVTIELDAAPREVEVPAALAEALAADPDTRASFEAMAFTHRKEYARWVAEAKKDETRQRRVQQALEMIRAGKTRT